MKDVDAVAQTFQPEDNLIAKYKRYTDGTARTEVADAIRQGKGLP